MIKTSMTKAHVVSLFLPQRCHPGLYMFPVFLPRECLKSTPEHTCFLSAVSKSLNSRTYVLSLSFFPRTIKIRTQARIWSSFLATQCRSSPSYVSKWDWKRPDVGFLSGLLKNIRVSTTSAGLLSLFCSKVQPRIPCAVSFFCSKSLSNHVMSWSPCLSSAARNRRATRRCAVSFFCSKILKQPSDELVFCVSGRLKKHLNCGIYAFLSYAQKPRSSADMWSPLSLWSAYMCSETAHVRFFLCSAQKYSKIIS